MLPAAAGTCLVSLGPKQTAPSCKATVGTSTAGTVSAGTAVPGLMAVLVVPGGGGTAGLQPLTSSPSWPELPPKPPPAQIHHQAQLRVLQQSRHLQ